MKKIGCFICILSCTILIFISCNQKRSIDKDVVTHVDSLFKNWNNNNSPGAAVSIIKDGKVIFSKAYGMANLEYDIPITSNTIFNIASESKQFTAFSIVLLEQQGKLSLDDDIRKYLPYVPDFGKKITIKNLLYHTSGLREETQLLAISGTRLKDFITQDDIIKLVEKQEQLSFNPGERHIYCNTGYTLLAEIIEIVSGQTLREFAKKEIFEPLEMVNTNIVDNCQEIIKNRVYSYKQKDSALFEKYILNASILGTTNVYTTVEDQVKWLNNYFAPKIFEKSTISRMYELGILNSGDTITYALGLNIDKYKGWKRIGHGGNEAGYKSYMVRFPEKNLGIIIFCNVSNIDQYKMALNIADLFLEDKSNYQRDLTIDYELYKDKLGKYCSNRGLVCELIDSSKLYLKIYGELEEMIPITDTTFAIFGGKSVLSFYKDKSDLIGYSFYDETDTLKKYKTPFLTNDEMEEYKGVYNNNEVGTNYEIIKKGENLILKHNRYNDVNLTLITNDRFSCPYWWMGNLIFIRDKNDEVIGFEINSSRVLHVHFNKLN